MGAGTGWILLLEHEEPPGFAIRRHPAPEAEAATPRLAEVQAEARAARPLSQLLGPLGLDSLTVADDGTFVERLRRQRNLSDFVKADLPDLF